MAPACFVVFTAACTDAPAAGAGDAQDAASADETASPGAHSSGDTFGVLELPRVREPFR